MNTTASTQHSFITRKPATAFVLFWLVLNLVQVAFTELTSDEGYYWFWSRHLQWGYYDHPPMVALLIKLGATTFPGEFGVRLFNVLCSTGALALFLSLLPEEVKSKRSTYLVLLSAPLLHYLGILIFPDGPLLLFSLLFLVTYKKFLAQQSVATTLLLALSLAGMAYAKYHSALVLLFTIIANPRLLLSIYFWLALSLAALLFLPHLWWQYQHQFPTFQYHLSGRQSQWSFRYVGEYLSQQLVAIGPGLVFVPFVSKANGIFERTLKAIVFGSFAFFLISSFKTFVHFHWTSIALFPLLYFAVQWYDRPQNSKWIKWLLVPFTVLLFIGRFLLMVPIIPAMHAGEDYYHGRKAWATQIAAIAKGRPVFMPNNLREAPLYSFYSGGSGITLYSRPGKKSQYELWGYEDSLQGKEVMLVAKDSVAGSRFLKTDLQREEYYSIIQNFRSYYHGIGLNVDDYSIANDSLVARITLTNNRQTALDFDAGSVNNSPTLLVLIEKGKTIVLAEMVARMEGTVAPTKGLEKRISVAVSALPKGEYKLYFGIRAGVLPDAILSEQKEIKVKD